MTIDVKKAEQMILAMNRVLRYSVASHKEYSTLEEDFEILEDFLMVNGIRFEGLSYQFAYPEHLAGLRVPKLFLLPLIENALKYGMYDRHQLMIEISVVEKADQILFEVADDGNGFSKAFLERFPTYLKEKGSQHGLINSYKRLEMLYSSSKISIKQAHGQNKVQLWTEKRQICIDSLL
ncbi:Inner membrane protein ypdA [Chlamydia trachomatis]|nr:Inner membrane protein ypdA [Chlamydia trachomatis]